MTPAENAELREFISEELRKVHDRVDQIHTRVDQVYVGQLDVQEHVAGHFGKVYTRLDDGFASLEAVSTRLYRVETQFEEMRSDFRAFGEGLGSANRRTEELRSDMNRGFEGLRSDMNRGTEELRSDMDRGFLDLREETSAGFRSWGERVVAVEDRVEGLEAKRG
ncbi:MAG: hypothetical protein ABIF09_15045 [Gemmatimonadota bacterium]